MATKSKISENTKKLVKGRKKGVEHLYKSPPKSHREEIKLNPIDLQFKSNTSKGILRSSSRTSAVNH